MCKLEMQLHLLSFLRDIHNDFHSGLGVTHLEMVLGIPEVDQASSVAMSSCHHRAVV